MRQAFREWARRGRAEPEPPTGRDDGAQPCSDAQPVIAATPPPPTAAAPATAESVSEDLWRRAYESLSEREPELVKDYEKHVQPTDGDGADIRVLSDPESVKALVKSLQDRREEAQWTFTIRCRDIKVSKQLESLVKLLALADGVVKTAVSGQPYAALAWSTVSVFIPLLSGGFAKQAAMVKGFATIGELLQYWKNYEDTSLPSTTSEQYKQLAGPLSNVYSEMLEYQVRAVCHLSKKQLSRAWHKMAGDDDWKAKEVHIISLSDRCLASLAPLQHETIIKSLAAQNEKLERLYSAEKGILETMQNHKREKKELELLNGLDAAGGNYKRAMRANTDPVPGTCEWFFADEDFLEWRDAPGSGVFWLTAGPGCGKSVLAKTLVKADHLTNPLTTVNIGSATVATRAAKVCYFFFREGEARRTSSSAALCALLHQLLSEEASSVVMRDARDVYEKNRDSLLETFEDLWDLFVDCVTKTGQDVICVLDALDECDAGARDSFIETLEEFYQGGTSPAADRLKFLITSRPYDDIVQSFRSFVTRARYYRFDADERHEEMSHDISLVIDANMKHFAHDFDEAECEKIATSLKEKGTNTYLWLYLTMEVIKRDPSLYSRLTDVEALIANIPSEVSEAYEKILSRTKDETRTGTLLQILLAATRPLTLDEANYALAYALADPAADSLPEPWRGDFRTAVKNFCGLLIHVHDGVLYFIHLTAREFLLQRSKQGSAHWGGRFADARLPNSVMSDCCVRYLCDNLDVDHDFSGWYTTEEEEKKPLLRYASANWPRHYRWSTKAAISRLLRRARALCDASTPGRMAWLHNVFRELDDYEFTSDSGNRWPSISVAAYVGATAVVQDMLRDGTIDLNNLDNGRLPLIVAVGSGYEDVCHLLLDYGADANIFAERKTTPLSVAAEKHHNLGITKLLLAYGADPQMELEMRFGNGRDSVIQAIAMEENKDLFSVMAASVADISTPQAVLAAFADEAFGKSSSCRAMLLDLLPDEVLGQASVLTPRVARILLALDGVGTRAVRLLFALGNHRVLFHKSVFSRLLGRPDARKQLRRFIRQDDACHRSISQRVLDDVARHGDMLTLALFVQHHPGDLQDVRSMLKMAVCNREHGESVAAILPVDGDDIVSDEELQKQLIDTGCAGAVIGVFKRMPRYTLSIARHLAEKMFASKWFEKRDSVALMKSVLTHCLEGKVISFEMVKSAARQGDAPLTRLLLDNLRGEIGDAVEVFVAAAATDAEDTKAIMEALVDQFGSEAATADPVLAVVRKPAMEFILSQFSTRVALTPRVLISIDCEGVLDLLFEWKPEEVARVALLAFRMYAYECPREMGLRIHTMGRILDSGIALTEENMLDMLETTRCSGERQMQAFALLKEKRGNLGVSDRIRAALLEAAYDGLDRQGKRRRTDRAPAPDVAAMAAAGDASFLALLDAASDSPHNINHAWHSVASSRKSSIQRSDGADKTPPSAIGAADVYGMTALHMAAACASYKVVHHVLARASAAKADIINAVDRRGWTALHHAAHRRDVYAVRALITAGANPRLEDHAGKTAADLARESAACALPFPEGLMDFTAEERRKSLEKVLWVLGVGMNWMPMWKLLLMLVVETGLTVVYYLVYYGFWT